MSVYAVKKPSCVCVLFIQGRQMMEEDFEGVTTSVCVETDFFWSFKDVLFSLANFSWSAGPVIVKKSIVVLEFPCIEKVTFVS